MLKVNLALKTFNLKVEQVTIYEVSYVDSYHEPLSTAESLCEGAVFINPKPTSKGNECVLNVS